MGLSCGKRLELLLPLGFPLEVGAEGIVSFGVGLGSTSCPGWMFLHGGLVPASSQAPLDRFGLILKLLMGSGLDVMAKSVPNLCQICVKLMSNLCQICVKLVPNPFSICAISVPYLCSIYAKSVTYLCQICAISVS